MTSPFDPFALQPQPVDDFMVPQHEASTVVVDEKPPTVRERLMGNRSPRQRRTSTEDKKANDKKAPPVEPGKYVQPMQDFYEMVGIVAMPFHPRFGMTMLNPAREPTEDETAKGIEPPSTARNCALAWDAAAQQSEAVRRALDKFMTASVMGTLFAAHAPLFMALASGTRLDPSQLMNRDREEPNEDE